MTTTYRLQTAAVADARQLWRRWRALVLLTALPLAFYAASSGHNPHAAVIGGIALAFSLTGAPIFASIAARAVDQRRVGQNVSHDHDRLALVAPLLRVLPEAHIAPLVEALVGLVQEQDRRVALERQR